MYKRIIVTGSVAYDHIMSMPSRFGDHILPDKIHIINVSFIMERFRREFGGTGGNISYNLSLLNVKSNLIATVGNDFHEYLTHLRKQKHIDTSKIKIYKKVPTASGFVMTDQDDNQIWGFYEGAMRYANKISLAKIFKKGDFLVIAPNNPLAMIRYAKEAVAAGIDYMFDPAFNIPHIPTYNLKEALENAKVVIGNDYEIALILERIGWNLHELLDATDIVVTTMGKDGSVISKDGKIIKIKSAKTQKKIIDPTGAGDAYRAGFLSGFIKGAPLKTCGQLGATCSVYTVDRNGTQTHHFTKTEFLKRYKDNFNEDLKI
ncbi:carbohydrate kinase family protein [Candidatus Woesebacteria bacterium]|nr:MAG: carbohydrate kinase family protein [Candidatus Woesebacteria bacterium]